MHVLFFVFFFFKQKTAYEMRISDWSSDVCSSDLRGSREADGGNRQADARPVRQEGCEEGACQEDGGEEGAGEEGREEKDVDEEDRRKKGNEKDGGEEDYHRGRRRPVLTNHRVRTQSSRKAGLPSGTSHAEAVVAAPTRALLFTGRRHRCARLGARAFVAP